MEENKTCPAGKSTRAIHGGLDGRSVYGEVSVPIFQSSTFSFPNAASGAARFAGEEAGFVYGRLGNPTVQALERALMEMEHGAGALATATGMAAVSTLLLALLRQGSHVVSTASLYGSSRVLLETELPRFGITATFVDTSDPQNVVRAMRPETSLVFVETPTNPTMILTDIAAVADVAHARGALIAVDNTFASPYLQRPIELGADLVIHSLTKYINGHSDVIGGAIISESMQIHARLKKMLTLLGGTMDPHQAWLILRGLRTMPLRVEKAQQNAMWLAEFLSGHPNVTWVSYPGLPNHPQHELAGRQMDGFGSMIAFGVKHGLEGGISVMNHVKLITLAVSLGGVESLIEHPASMTHASVAREEREEAGILDDLVRLSVGCEDVEDLRDDLDQALNSIEA